MSEHIGLKLDPKTHDLVLEGNNLCFVHGAHAVGQHAKQRLMMFEGEWFLDTQAGIAWIPDLLGNAYDPALAEAVIKAELAQTHGVREITSFSVGFDRDVRRLRIGDVGVLTTYDREVSL